MLSILQIPAVNQPLVLARVKHSRHRGAKALGSAVSLGIDSKLNGVGSIQRQAISEIIGSAVENTIKDSQKQKQQEK